MKIKKMIANKWNYNRMTDEDFEFMEEDMERNYKSGKPLWIGDKVVVCEIDNPVYSHRILDGFHRVKALMQLSIPEIPDELVLNLGKISELEQRRITEIKNVRGNKDPIKYALFLKKQQELEGLSQVEFAQKRKMSKGTLSKILKRTELPKELQEKISLAKLSASVLDEILTLPKNQWEGMINYTIEASLTKAKTREIVSHVKSEDLTFEKGYLQVRVRLDSETSNICQDVWREQKRLGFRGTLEDFLSVVVHWDAKLLQRLSFNEVREMLEKTVLDGVDKPASPELQMKIEKIEKEFLGEDEK